MRLGHRLSQYQRLYHQLGSTPVAITIGELAAIFYCSERHARTLVQQLQQQGWLSWQSQAGRGKRAQLQCLQFVFIRQRLQLVDLSPVQTRGQIG